jgi:site-specific DNA recombinase
MYIPINVAGYIRVSSGKQVKEGESLGEQRRLIEEYAKFNNFCIYKIYSEEGISGAVADRASLDNLKSDANRSLFQKVIFCSLDRFGRSAQDLLNNYEYFEKKGIALVSLREKIDTSIPAGRFLRTVLGAVAELEREMLRERTIIGLVARMRRGLRPVGRIPYGYRWDKKRRTFKTVLREKKAYHEAVDIYLNGGKSVTEVAGILNEKGYRTRQGERFTRSSLLMIFKNPFYKGEWDIHFQGETFSYHPIPVVDTDIWEKLQERIKKNIIKWGKINASKDPYLLRKLLQCECGSLLQCCRHNMRYYACRSSKMSEKARLASNSKKRCCLPYVNANEIENLIWSEIWRCFLLSVKNIMEGKSNDLITKEENLEGTLSETTGRIEGEKEAMKKLVILDELLRKMRKGFEDMAYWQKRELISQALGDKKLRVRVLRKRDMVESDIGLPKNELNDPVHKKYRGKILICWAVEGDWILDCIGILKHLFQKSENHFILANYENGTVRKPV